MTNRHPNSDGGQKFALCFTYQVRGSLYINVTNRCNANCVFCGRKGDAVINGYSLKMKESEEPSADVYIREVGDPRKYREIVFCGYGEPTIRWDVVKRIARQVKENGGLTRMNTNGHGSFINQRDIAPELAGLIDSVSISLNSSDPEQYSALMNVNPALHGEMIDFALRAKKFAHVVMSVVGLQEVDRVAAKKLVTDKIGVEFREREYLGG